MHLVRHAQSNWNALTAGEHVGQHPDLGSTDLSASGAFMRVWCAASDDRVVLEESLRSF